MQLTGSDGVTIELDRRYYAEFKRQVRAASTALDDHSAEMQAIMREALQPLVKEWQQRLPGSLKATAKAYPASLTVRAGFKSASGDHPFLPWLEFGGTVTWYRQPAFGDFKRVPVYGFRMRKVMGLTRARNAEGNYRGPAVKAGIEETNAAVADGIQEMFCRVFHAP